MFPQSTVMFNLATMILFLLWSFRDPSMSVDRAYYESPFVCHLIGLFAHYRGYDFASCIILFFLFSTLFCFQWHFPLSFSLLRWSAGAGTWRGSALVYTPSPFFTLLAYPFLATFFFLISQMQTDVAVVVLWRGQEMLTIAWSVFHRRMCWSSSLAKSVSGDVLRNGRISPLKNDKSDGPADYSWMRRRKKK